MKRLNIMVTGGAGYIGSVLIPSLLEDGHNVSCLDRFFFGDEYLSSNFKDGLTLIKDDIRWFDPKILKNIDLVMDLAALSNDPVGELDPKKTDEINHLGRSRVARLSKENGVPQYILASSASVYGQQSAVVDEDSQVNPLTAYSKANRAAEIDNLALNDDDFTVTVLRFSSIFGLSPRMRFDLAVNSFVLDFFNTGKIIVQGKNNRRPFLHIKDAIRAYKLVVKSAKNKIADQIFNVGSDNQNYLIYDLAHEIRDAIGNNCEIETKDTRDNRSYVASFKKIRSSIGFESNYDVKYGAGEIFDALQKGSLKPNQKMITLQWYKRISADPELFKQYSINGKIL
jgi:nucleoside-diphosphate-sugar epimerase